MIIYEIHLEEGDNHFYVQFPNYAGYALKEDVQLIQSRLKWLLAEMEVWGDQDKLRSNEEGHE